MVKIIKWFNYLFKQDLSKTKKFYCTEQPNLVVTEVAHKISDEEKTMFDRIIKLKEQKTINVEKDEVLK